MYHVGKVLRIFEANTASADSSMQVHLEMWDSNEIIVLVHAALSSKIRENDFVLVRYGQPEPTVWRILKPKEGKEIWDSLNDFLSRKKNSNQTPIQGFGRIDPGMGRMVG